jgi:hypothetical protein
MPPDLGFDEWVNSMSNMALLRLIDEALKGEMNCPRRAEGREVMRDNFQIMREKFDQKRREYETAENLRLYKENNEMRARIAELEAENTKFRAMYNDLQLTTAYNAGFEKGVKHQKNAQVAEAALENKND